MASGLMYTARLQGVPVTNIPQNLWEIIAGSSALLIHSIRIEFLPTIVSGVDQDGRAAIAIQSITTTGTGGTAVTPAAEHPRNTVAALTTFNSLVTNPGTADTVKSASYASTIPVFERIFTMEQRIPITGSGRLAINLTPTLAGTFFMSSEIYFEEW